MKQAVDAFAERHRIFLPEDHILVAVSGGPDSIALLDYLYVKSKETGFQLSVLHVHHHLREEADQDCSCAEKAALSRFLPFHVKHAEVIKRKKEEGWGTQQAAREERYELFIETMQETGANKVATAHHGDDQAETLLMRFVRGSMEGRKGIPVKRTLGDGEVIRPFLSVTKEEIMEYCAEQELLYRTDYSNLQNTYQRNRLRNEVMPLLKEENPKLHESAQWQAERSAEEEEYLNSQAGGYLHTFKKGKEEIRFQQTAFQSIPRALQRRVVHLILNYLMPSAPWSRQHVEAVFSLCFSDKASQRTSIGYEVWAEKSYNHLLLSSSKEKSPAGFTPFTLKEKTVYTIPAGTIRVQQNRQLNKGEVQAVFQLNPEQLPLQVRTRLPGDRISAEAGTKKLKKLFIDAKIPRKLRDVWPIVTDIHGTILWVPFLQKAEMTQKNNYKQQTIYLAFKPGTDLLLFH
ncbi:tRNA lysidine(34) synthetase TilS [Alkalicoccus daliensis]|uniref:tRNA(Ile)-lysidine synthase n=1 Tax=Alkalicoccus daliensis TaxID=745820 RepID=A0A1H0KVB7_9BACI|nr:tRNA lysidine(34) synthetase TilS [Alkalicoccus daliensis]SDO59964.1 tRNA(Ile)-lysidine synthase [Alkalicoccus daliensis]